MITHFEARAKIVEKKQKYFKNYLYWCKKIKKKARELLGKDVKVLVFGSVVRGDFGPNSDIDVLIISKNLKKDWSENNQIKVEIKKEIGFFTPFQIHLATPEEFKNWYKKFIKKDFKVIE